MGSCCDNKSFDGTSQQYKRILIIVIALNAIMFGVEMVAGVVANSQALMADALDFLADSATYTISLLVIGKAVSIRTKAALFKGISLSAIGIWVLLSTLYRVFITETPEALTMGLVGFAALAVNLSAVILLMRYREGDANVRSVWLCSRNDAIGNVMVMIAASGVWASQTSWPDLIVAFVMSALFINSSFQIIRQAIHEKQHAH